MMENEKNDRGDRTIGYIAEVSPDGRARVELNEDGRRIFGSHTRFEFLPLGQPQAEHKPVTPTVVTVRSPAAKEVRLGDRVTGGTPPCRRATEMKK